VGASRARASPCPWAEARVLWRALLLTVALGSPVAWLAACGGGRASAPVEYVVQRGDTLYSVARRFGVSVEELARANGIDDPSALSVGRRLVVPGHTRLAHVVEGAGGKRCAVDDDARRAAHQQAEDEASLEFEWPLQGGVTSCFGERHSRPHEGIDVQVPDGTRIYAAESGKVIYSGRLGGYGQLVVLKHAGPYSTVYAHLSERNVDVGEFVEKGAEIGESGSSGNATGPHLHFEIRRSQRPTDPLLYLP